MNHSVYVPACATDIRVRFKDAGWVRPSKDPEIIAKWASHKANTMPQKNPPKMGEKENQGVNE